MEKKKINLKDIGMKRLVIICLAGLALLALSLPDIFSLKGGQKPSQTAADPSADPSLSGSQTTDSYTRQMEKRLEDILKKVDGIGNVEVMLTLKSSGEQVTLKDEPYKQDNSSETDSQGGSRVTSSIDKSEETVLVKSDKGDSMPYVIKEIEPRIEGAVIIAQGGDRPEIINEINNAIEVLFGVPVHKIKVMKMVDEGKNPY